MDTLVLHAPKNFDKLIANSLNIAIIGCLAFSQNLISTPPMFADEVKLAHNVVAPIISREQPLIRELTQAERAARFDREVKTRYPKGVVIDVDRGIKHIRLTKYYQGKPVRINIVEINKSLNPDITVSPALASETLARKSSITTIAKRTNSIVAINGTFFKPQSGVPLGTLMINKKMYTGPIYDRVAMGVFDNGFDMARIQLNASLQAGKNVVKVDNINQPRMLSSYVLVYTPEWGKMSPATPQYGKQLAVSNGKITGFSNGSMSIPSDGYVVVGPTDKLKQFYDKGKISLAMGTSPEWKDVNHIISGGPYLVKNGEVFVDMTAQKLGSIGGRNPRSAIGYSSDNNLVIVAVDGRENASIGMTLMELAGFMKEIGCSNAMNLDGGGSTVMYVNGKIVNNPHVKGGIALSNALTVSKG